MTRKCHFVDRPARTPGQMGRALDPVLSILRLQRGHPGHRWLGRTPFIEKIRRFVPTPGAMMTGPTLPPVSTTTATFLAADVMPLADYRVGHFQALWQEIQEHGVRLQAEICDRPRLYAMHTYGCVESCYFCNGFSPGERPPD